MEQAFVDPEALYHHYKYARNLNKPLITGSQGRSNLGSDYLYRQYLGKSGAILSQGSDIYMKQSSLGLNSNRQGYKSINRNLFDS